MNFKILLRIAILVLVCSAVGYSKPRNNGNNGNPFQFSPLSPNTLTPQRIILNPNNVSAYFQNSGIFDQNTTSGNLAGLEWPKGSGKTACFTAGLSIGCMINTSQGPKLAEVMASYKGEYAPSSVPVPPSIVTGTPSGFKMYVVKAGDNANTNPDYANWKLMIPYGAPFTDVNNNGQYDDGIDIPGQKNAAMTMYECMSDAQISERNSLEGFGGGINAPILFAEVHWSAWAYTTPGLEDMQFINWVVINKDTTAWHKTFMGVVVDPDLGWANDDYIGCDTTTNLGYCYNGTNNDQQYGTAPPAFGMVYFRSPVIRATNDTLGLTSFVYFSNTSVNPPACESDPNGEAYPAYLMLQGFKKDSTCYLDPMQPTGSSYKKTKFVYPGDPETGTGWTEFTGSIPQCNRDSTGTIVTPNPVGDRRFIFNSGSQEFTMNPGDTQNIIVAQFVQRGSSNKNSVTKLKRLARTARIIYNANFNVTPPPPPPVVNTSFIPTLNGQCNVSLNWGDVSESYRYWDSIFHTPLDTNIYLFQGYEIYEINKFSNSIPDFSKPETIDPTQIKLIDIFDKKDNIGVVIDTFQTYDGQYAPFPIIPPYKMTAPAGFPNKGISRSITLTGTQFSENYGGQSKFIYGQEYQFAVVAYAVSISKSDALKKGFRVIANSVGSQMIKVRPVGPPAGTIYSARNGDTLNLDFPIRDLALSPIIRNETLLQNAIYRVEIRPDTTYMILRKLASSSGFTDTLQRGLKWVPIRTTADDSSRTFDGIFFNLQKLRNFGVLQDPTLGTDSIQTRKYGWEYNPPGNRYLEGAKVIMNNQVPTWQSKSMSLTYPNPTWLTNQTSKLPVEKTRVIKIKYTGYGNGQNAYRYLGYTGDTIQDPSFLPFVVRRKALNNWFIFQDKREVPFKVYEIDPFDSSETERQLNCGFVENNRPIPQGNIDGKFDPNADSTGGNEYLYIFNSNYSDPAWDPIYSDTVSVLGLFLASRYDIMYVWAPKLINSGSNFNVGDEFIIYPYAVQRPFYYSGSTNPFFYQFTTVAPLFGNQDNAKNSNAMNNIKVVPNPYYGFSTLDRSTADKFVTFRNLPLECTIKIYSLNGDLIRTLTKTQGPNPASSSTMEWNLQNQDRTPVASGIYVALVDAPGIGQKVLKIVVFVSQERINF
jgi:hypothetical protein